MGLDPYPPCRWVTHPWVMWPGCVGDLRILGSEGEILAFPCLCWRWVTVPTGLPGRVGDLRIWGSEGEILASALCEAGLPAPRLPAPDPAPLPPAQWSSTPLSLGPCSCCAFSPALSSATSWTGGSRTVWTPPLPGDLPWGGDGSVLSHPVSYSILPRTLGEERPVHFTDEETETRRGCGCLEMSIAGSKRCLCTRHLHCPI